MTEGADTGRGFAREIEVAPFIDGKICPSSSDKRFVLFNPATGEASVETSAGCAEDTGRAVASARAAFEDGRWSARAPVARSAILHKFADLIETEADAFDRLDAEDMGKPVSLAYANAAAGAALVRSYADLAVSITGDSFDGGGDCMIVQARLPRGVVGAVTPWNFPTVNALIKAAPALAAGNCVVLKPSEYSPRSAQRLAALALEAGVPPGVLNLTPGKGETVGKALALHSDVDMLTFTGSTAVGRLMLQYAGWSNLKLVHAECGGKSPQIVFPDFEDLDVVADNVAQMILVNQGQLCVAGSRLIAHRDVEKVLVAKVVDRLKQAVIGDPLNPENTLGPLVSERQLDRVLSYIRTGREQGGHLVAGGRRVLEETGGYFVEPAVFSNVQPQDVIAQEEIFGPVLAESRFDTVEQAISLANATRYGLSATVWTQDMRTAMHLARNIRAGSLTVNADRPKGAWAPALSVEPCRHSGIGVEGGLAGLESYMRRQTLSFNHA